MGVGQTRKSPRLDGISGLPPIATELRTSLVVRFVPNADSSNEWAAGIEEDPIDNILMEATPSP